MVTVSFDLFDHLANLLNELQIILSHRKKSFENLGFRIVSFNFFIAWRDFAVWNMTPTRTTHQQIYVLDKKRPKIYMSGGGDQTTRTHPSPASNVIKIINHVRELEIRARQKTGFEIDFLPLLTWPSIIVMLSKEVLCKAWGFITCKISRDKLSNVVSKNRKKKKQTYFVVFFSSSRVRETFITKITYG